MARYLLECTIDPAQLDLLAAKRADHYAFLLAHRDAIVCGGPARAHPDGPPQTMIMVIDTPSAEAAHAFLAAEPYNRGGAFSNVTIRPFSQVIPEPVPGSLQHTLDAERSARHDHE
jgi:uncharacterized protein